MSTASCFSQLTTSTSTLTWTTPSILPSFTDWDTSTQRLTTLEHCVLFSFHFYKPVFKYKMALPRRGSSSTQPLLSSQQLVKSRTFVSISFERSSMFTWRCWRTIRRNLQVPGPSSFILFHMPGIQGCGTSILKNAIVFQRSWLPEA